MPPMPIQLRTALRQALARPVAFRPRSGQPSSARWNSSSTEGAQKKAQEALAGAGNLWEGAKRFLEPVGRGVGRLLGSYKQPLLYNLAVTREVLKQIYVAEGLQPPTSLATIRAAYETLWTRASSGTYWRGAMGSGEALRVGVYAAEAYGIFKIGEILGRRHLVGYKLE